MTMRNIIVCVISLIYSFTCYAQVKGTIVEGVEICFGFEYYDKLEELEITSESISDTIRGNIGYLFTFKPSNKTELDSVEIQAVLIRGLKGVITERYFDEDNKLHRKKMEYYDEIFKSSITNIKFWECSSRESMKITSGNRIAFVFPFVIIPKDK